MEMIAAHNVAKSYQVGKVAVPALRNVTFTINEGEIVSFIGPSGSGKTTLLNMIGCLDRPTSGTLTVDGTNVASLDRKAAAGFRGNTIGFIFQEFNLVPIMTVYENIEYPLVMVKNIATSKRKEAVSELIRAVGLEEHRDKLPDQLSGGQKQRVAIARALVSRPRMVLADEPTANLDHKTAYDILALMRTIRDTYKTTFIFSTHDPKIVGEAEIIYTIEDGAIKSREDKRGGRS
ncbi:MAG: ABC transporter ATP-binding protein [Chitinispirillaceae bacterium]|nr:ABC transporter ATP-binding protein [Chitinispirillaceae bacterium]